MKIKTSKSEIKFTSKATYKTAPLNLVKKEYNVIKLLQKHKKLANFLPENIALNQNILSYKYIKGTTAGYFLTDYGYKSGLFTREKFNQFISFHYNLSKIKNKKLQHFAQIYNYNYALNELKHYKKNNPEILTKKKWQQAFDKLDQNKHLFNTQNMALSHFDMYPENLIITNNSFKVIDWESLMQLPNAFIPAFFNLVFEKEKIWKDLSIKRFYTQDENFKTAFALFSVILSIRFIYQINAYPKINDVNKVAINSFYKIFNTYITQSEIKVKDIRFLIDKPLVISIIKPFKLGKYIKHMVYEKSFSNNVVYVKTTKGQFIIKIFNTNKSVKDYKNEIKIVNLLRENNLPVYKIINNQRYISKFINFESYGYKRMYYVASFISGYELNRHSFTLEHVKEMAKMLKKIHSLGVIHGDFSKRNLIFNNNKIMGVLDFEYAEITKKKDDTINDLAHAIILLLISYSASYIPFEKRINLFLSIYFYKDQELKSNLPLIKSFLIFHAENEKKKYLTLNPTGNTAKYDKIINYLIFKFNLISNL